MRGKNIGGRCATYASDTTASALIAELAEGNIISNIRRICLLRLARNNAGGRISGG